MLSNHSPQTVLIRPEQKTAITAGLADYQAGRFVTQDELDRKDAEWL